MDCGKGVIGDGDFVFALIDRILERKHGDVLIYNPQHNHGTTIEFICMKVISFLAFFMKKMSCMHVFYPR